MMLGIGTHTCGLFSNRTSSILLLVSLSILPYGVVPVASSQVTTNIQGNGLGTIVTPQGNMYDITVGTRVGTNVFHSFEHFTVGPGDIANFQNLKVGGSFPITDNILAKVTPLAPSFIYGTLRTTDFGNANLFLMNPAGVVFGPTSSLDMGAVTQGARGTGSFFATTANYLQLGTPETANAGIFSAHPSVPDVLTSTPVTAFGFLGGNPAAIYVQGNTLQVAEGASISIVGGSSPILLPDGTMSPSGVTLNGTTLSAPSGQIQLASMASAGQIRLADMALGQNINGETPSQLGSIRLENTTMNVGGSPGGVVRIRGGELILDHASIVGDNTGESIGEPIALQADVQNSITLKNQSQISSDALGTGPSGSLLLAASDLEVRDGSRIRTRSQGGGSAGDIEISTSNSVSVVGTSSPVNSSLISSESNSSGNAGTVRVTTSSLTLDDRGRIEILNTGEGFAGDINLHTDQIAIRNGGGIVTSGSDFTPSGNIHITNTNTLTISGQFDFDTRSRIVSENPFLGGTGTISIETGRLEMSGGARIFSDTFFDPVGSTDPKISIHATGDISLTDGSRILVQNLASNVGGVEISANDIMLNNLSTIDTATAGEGNAGPITITAKDVTLSGGSQLTSSSDFGAGRGGDVALILTGKLTIEGQSFDEGGSLKASGIVSSTSGFDPILTIGDAGAVSINASAVEIRDGGRIDTSTTFFGGGNAGTIAITTPQLRLSGGTIASFTESAGNAGTILIKTESLTVSEGGQITTNSALGMFGQVPSGNAGAITVQGLSSPAISVRVEGNGSGIFTNTEGTGSGGNIIVSADSVTIQNGGTLSAKTSGTEATATGGSIAVNTTDHVTMIGDASITASSTGPGNAGNISINAGQQFEMRNSSVKTESAQASGGNIDIQAVDRVRLVNSSISTSVLGGTGSGGNITIDPNVVVLQNSQILAQAVQGAGGNITIFTPLYLKDSSSVVSASSQFGLNGTVTIQSPTSNLSGSVGTLPSNPSQAQSLLTQRCTALVNGQASSFVVAGREQLPADPGGWLSSPIALAAVGQSLDADEAVASPPAVMPIAAHGTGTVSLRRLTPAGFLIANFADSEATGCHS
jgi:filamentous hemagglutinin family protein